MRFHPGLVALFGMAAAAEQAAAEGALARTEERWGDGEPPTPEELAAAKERWAAELEARDQHAREAEERRRQDEHRRLMEGSRKYATAQAKRERKRQLRLARGGK